ncbi:hypothetical protein L1276_003849 [Flavobacterium sp. HSC-32F16]|uniref:hypothetical protein n=1 Tax=Flavobacterium sp. HSC-32F16 TaxID=2910964 RepID=UPI0020A28CE5|nr:hypothetical protein [Flavobacterium sp. HSC-32F16]MCP2028678.1 hypothetical protein [Flavobacterium sp. HSC-32F16]
MKKEVIYNLTNKFLTIILLITIIANVFQFYNYKTYEKIDWDGMACTPKGYPVVLSPNVFYSNGGKYITLIPNMSDTGGSKLDGLCPYLVQSAKSRTRSCEYCMVCTNRDENL